MTKEKFERELKKAAYNIALEKKRKEIDRMKQISGNNAAASAESYGVLKHGIILGIHLVVSLLFYLNYAENEVLSKLRDPIINYFKASKFDTTFSLDDIQTSYIQPVTRLSKFNLNNIGTSASIGNIGLRCTYRFYNVVENDDKNTNYVFSQAKGTNFDLSSSGVNDETSWGPLKSLLTSLESNEPEKMTSWQWHKELGLSKGYTQPSNEYNSLYGEGGYVFLFEWKDGVTVDALTDADDLLLYNEDNIEPITFGEFAEATNA